VVVLDHLGACSEPTVPATRRAISKPKWNSRTRTEAVSTVMMGLARVPAGRRYRDLLRDAHGQRWSRQQHGFRLLRQGIPAMKRARTTKGATRAELESARGENLAARRHPAAKTPAAADRATWRDRPRRAWTMVWPPGSAAASRNILRMAGGATDSRAAAEGRLGALALAPAPERACATRGQRKAMQSPPSVRPPGIILAMMTARRR
jgi:hypothetical protein